MGPDRLAPDRVGRGARAAMALAATHAAGGASVGAGDGAMHEMRSNPMQQSATHTAAILKPPPGSDHVGPDRLAPDQVGPGARAATAVAATHAAGRASVSVGDGTMREMRSNPMQQSARIGAAASWPGHEAGSRGVGKPAAVRARASGLQQCRGARRQVAGGDGGAEGSIGARRAIHAHAACRMLYRPPSGQAGHQGRSRPLAASPGRIPWPHPLVAPPDRERIVAVQPDT